MSDGPDRHDSQELTAVIPRDCLPPPSGKLLATLELDPDHPETVDLVGRAVDDEEDCEGWRTTPTLVPCPAGCGSCSCCGGRAIVSAEAAAEWRIQQASALSEPDDD